MTISEARASRRRYLRNITDREVLVPVIFILFIFFFVAFVSRGLILDSSLAVGDLTPWHQNLTSLLHGLVYYWNPSDFGSQQPFLPGRVAIEIITTAVMAGNRVLAQRAYFFSILPLSGVFMYFFLRRGLNGSFASSAGVAFAYAFNAATIPFWILGGEPPLFLNMTFPLILWSFVSLLKGPSLLRATTFSMIFSFSFLQEYQGPIAFAPFLVAFLTWQLFAKGRPYARKMVPVFGVLVAEVLFLSLPVLLQSFQGLVSFYQGSGVGFNIGLQTQQPRASLEHELNDIVAYYSWGAVGNLSVIAGILAVPFFLVSARRRREYYCFLILAAVFIEFWVLTATGWTLPLFSLFPFLFAVKTPLLSLMIVWAILLTIATVTSDWRHLPRLKALENNYLRKDRHPIRRSILGGVALIVLVTVPSFMFFSWNFNRSLSNPLSNIQSLVAGTRGWTDGISANVTVPANAINAIAWINARREEQGTFRTLWIPSDPAFQNKVLQTYDPMTFTPRAFVNLTAGAVLSLIQLRTHEFGHTIGAASARYVIVADLGRSGWEPSDYAGPPRLREWSLSLYWVGDPLAYRSLLDQQHDLVKRVDFGDVAIYENEAFQPEIGVFNRISIVASSTMLRPFKSSTIAELPNLLQNPGFENGFAGWTVESGYNATYMIDTALPEEGANSALVRGSGSHYGAVGQIVPVGENTSYVLTYWMRSLGAQGFAKVSFYDLNHSLIDSQAVQPDVDNSNWTQDTGQVFSPPKSVSAYVALYSTARADSVLFDNISFVKGYLTSPHVPQDSIVQVGSHRILVSDTRTWTLDQLSTNFHDQTSNLILVEDEIPKSTIFEYYKFAQIGVLLEDVVDNSTRYGIAHLPVLMYLISPSSFVPTQGKWVLVDPSGTIKSAGLGQLSRNFFTPRLGPIQFIVHATRMPLAYVDSMTLSLHQTENSMYVSDAVEIAAGRHSITLETEQPTTFGQIFLLSFISDTSSALFWQIIPEEIKVEHSSPVDYSLRITTSGPFFVSLGETFSPGWVGEIDGHAMIHLPTYDFGWANGFYSSIGGPSTVHLYYAPQTTRDGVLVIWGLAWLCLTATVIILGFRGSRRSRSTEILSNESSEFSPNATIRREVLLK